MTTEIPHLEDCLDSCSAKLEHILTEWETNVILLSIDQHNQQLRNRCGYLYKQVKILHIQYVIICEILVANLQHMDNTSALNLCIPFTEQCHSFEARIRVIMPTVRTILYPLSIPELEPESESESEPEAQPEPEPKSEPESKADKFLKYILNLFSCVSSKRRNRT